MITAAIKWKGNEVQLTDFFRKLAYQLVHIMVFLLPMHKKMVPIAIAVTLVAAFFSNSWEEKKTLFKKRFPFILLFSSLYLMHVVGLLYTENFDYALFDLEIKVSMLLFPLIFLTSRVVALARLKKILQSFVLGCLVAAFICFAHAFYQFRLTGDALFFYYEEFSVFHHPSYFSMYLNLAVAILIILIFDQKNKIKVSYFVLLTLFIITIFQLSSKSGILSLGVILTYTLIYYIVPRLKWFNSFLGLLITVAISSLVIYNSQYTFSRFIAAKNTLAGEEDKESSTGLRMAIWSSALETIKENPLLGVGTGDIKDQLLENYSAESMEKALNERLNAHNQYLQIALALGGVGLLLLLLSFSIPFFYSIRHQSILYGMFIFIVAFNFLTESVLETQSGAVFYAIFNTFLFFTIEKETSFVAETTSKQS